MTKENIKILHKHYTDTGQKENLADIEKTKTFKDNKDYILKEDKPTPPTIKKVAEVKDGN